MPSPPAATSGSEPSLQEEASRTEEKEREEEEEGGEEDLSTSVRTAPAAPRASLFILLCASAASDEIIRAPLGGRGGKEGG